MILSYRRPVDLGSATTGLASVSSPSSEAGTLKAGPKTSRSPPDELVVGARAIGLSRTSSAMTRRMDAKTSPVSDFEDDPDIPSPI